MANLILNGSTSGSVTLSSPAVSGTTTLTLPATSGTVITTGSTFAGTGPTFSAYLSTNQSVSSATYTKVQCNTEEFDTNSNYDNATNYRFTPTVAGYYQVNGAIDVGTSAITAGIATIYKNGSAFKFGVGFGGVNVFNFNRVTVSALVYLNGSSDYVELYGYVIATTPIFYGGSSATYFQAAMVRSA
jgi:hypothetical protein